MKGQILRPAIFLIIFIGILLVSIAHAEFHVFYNKSTNDILFISEDKDDVVLSEDDTVKIKDQKMTGDIEDYPLQYPIEYYKLINKTFVVNTQKLSDEANQATENAGKQAEWRKVKMRAFYTAYLDLTNEIEFKYLKLEDFEQ